MKINFESNILVIFFFYSSCSGFVIKKKIYGGWPANISDYPFHVLLQERWVPIPFSPWKKSCGGSLVAKRWVLTAAKCHRFAGTQTFDLPRILIGTDKTNTFWENNSYIHYAEKFLANTYYKETNRNYYDIALIRLKKEVEFSSKIRPVLMPGENEDKDYDVGLILGFGLTTASEWIGPDHLRGTNVKIVRGPECEHVTVNTYKLNIELCGSWTSGEGPCEYDSGGGLVTLREDGDFVILGIISERQGICGSKQIVRYTRVGAMLDWIIEQVGQYPDGIPSLDTRP